MDSLPATNETLNVPPASGAGKATQHESLDLTKSLAITIAPTIDARGKWDSVEYTREGLVERLLDHKVGSKEGDCFLQGELLGKDRAGKAMLRNHLLVYDFDKGEPIQELVKRLKETGYAFVVYSSHSHGSETTHIRRDDLLKHFPEYGAAHSFDENDVTTFLTSVRAVRASVLEGLQIENQAAPSKDGTVVVARHLPIEKCRVVFFLHEPFELQGQFDTADRMREWSDRYRGFGKANNLPFDDSCKDVARAFYFARHKTKASRFVAEFHDGREVCLADFPRVPAETSSDKRPPKLSKVVMTNPTGYKDKAKFTVDLMVGDLNLRHWVQAYDFRITSALVEAGYECRVPPDGGKATFPCPFEDEHSAMQGQDYGFFAVDFDGEANMGAGFHMQCMHSHGSSHDRLSYLKALIERGYLPIEYLTDERFAVPKLTAEKAAEKLKQLDAKDTMAGMALAKEIALAPIEDAVRDGYFTLIARKTGITKKAMQGLVPKAVSGGAAELQSRLKEYNEQHAVVRLGSSTVVLDLGGNGLELDYFSVKAFQDFRANDKVKVGDNLESVAARWMEWEERQTFQRIEFEPSSPTVGNYNLFKGFNRVESDQSKDWSLIRSHLLEVLCSGNSDHYNWLMTWLANIIQRPEDKLGSAVVVRGEKGSGKSIIFDAFAELLQPYTFKTAQSEQIIGKFNWHLSNKLLLIAEEAFFAGDTQADSAMKNLITSKEMAFEKKGHESTKLNNYLRLVIISNEDWIVRSSQGTERRYFVLQAADTFIGDMGYFDRLSQQIGDGGLSGFRYALENWVPPYDQGWNILRSPPQTEWLEEQSERSTQTWDDFFLEAIENGFFEGGENLIRLSDDQPTSVKVKDLFECYNEALGAASFARNKANTKSMVLLLRKHLKATKHKRNDGVYYIIPPLNLLRDKKQVKAPRPVESASSLAGEIELVTMQ